MELGVKARSTRSSSDGTVFQSRTVSRHEAKRARLPAPNSLKTRELCYRDYGYSPAVLSGAWRWAQPKEHP